MANTKDPFLLLSQLANDIWNENKGLTYQSHLKPHQKRYIIARMKGMVEQVKAIDWEKEFDLLIKFHKL